MNAEEVARWRIYRRTLGKWRQAFAYQEAALGVHGPDTDGWVEVVELSRLRAAEDRGDRLAEAVVVVPKPDDVTENYMVAVSRLKAERDRLALTLRQIRRNAAVGSIADSLAREALASLEGGNDGPP